MTPVSRTSHRKGAFLIHVTVKGSPSGSWLVSKQWLRDPAAPILLLRPRPRRGAPAIRWALAVFFTLPNIYSRLKVKGGENIKVRFIVSYQQIEIYSFFCYFKWLSGKHYFIGNTTHQILNLISVANSISIWFMEVILKCCCCYCLATQQCLTLCRPHRLYHPGSTVHGISQARTLEWVDIPFSRGSSRPKDGTWVSSVAGGFFTIWATRGAHRYHTVKKYSVRPCWASLRDIPGLILHQGAKSVCLMTHELPFTLKHKSFATLYNNRRALYRKIKSFQRKVFYYSTKLSTE